MTQLAALNIKITGDSGDLTAAVTAAKGQLGGLNTAMTQTQAKAGAMGGALGGLASRMQGARGQIQNVSFQLQDMAVQLGAGTAASVVFAQQGSQIASAFGPVGAVIGALAAVGIPALAFAFSDGTAKATAFEEALQGVKDAAQSAATELAILRSGGMIQTAEEVRLLKEIGYLVAEQTRLREEAVQAEGLVAQQLIDQADAMNGQINAARAQLANIQQINAEIEKTKQIQEAQEFLAQKANETAATFRGIMNQINQADISLPWRNVLGWIDEAAARARSAFSIANYEAELANTGQASGPDAARTQTQFGGGAFRAPVRGAGLPAETVGGGGGGGATTLADQLQSELEVIQESLMSQEQLQMESYARQQEVLNQALQQRLITQEEYQRLMEQAQATHDFAMTQSVNDGVSQTLSALGQLFQGSKKISAAIALANSWLAFTEVLKDPALPWWQRIPQAAAALASGLQAVQSIKSASPSGAGATGGATAGAATGAAPQQNVQTLNFTVQNDPFGFGQNLVRQLAAQLNEAQRNGSTLVRATVT